MFPMTLGPQQHEMWGVLGHWRCITKCGPRSLKASLFSLGSWHRLLAYCTLPTMICGPPQRLSKWNSSQGQKKLFLSKLSQVFCKHNTKLTYILILGLTPFLNWVSLDFLPSYWDLQRSPNSSSSNSPVSSIHWSLSCTSSNGTFVPNTH